MDAMLPQPDTDEILSGIAADVLSYEKYEKFLLHLLERPCGMWHRTTDLMTEVPEICARLASVEREHDLRVSVTWLEHPLNEEGYCVITFFCDSTLWSYLASYNVKWIAEKYGFKSPLKLA